MPVQQIAVLPARETASNGKSAPHSKDKNEGRKVPGRSGSRSSNISKGSNSTTGPVAASRTSITTSSQDICSSGQLTRLEEEVSALHKHNEQAHKAVMTVNSTALDSLSRSQKKQVKRRHRHKKKSCTGFDCVETNTTQTDRSDLSSDRSEVKTQPFRSRRELPPRLRCAGAFQSDSSSEDEVWCESRSWSKEKARRARRHSEGNHARDGANGEKGQECRTEITEIMELQSMGSSEGMENEALAEESGSLKKRHSSKSSTKKDDHKSQREGDKSGYKSGGSSPVGEDGEERITKRYQEKVSGGENMSVPSPQAHYGMNGGTVGPYSESELEVCRICHCEGDDECPLIMPCRCTGSLSFVHQACLNQWIKSSDTRCCELCKYDFIMETKLKPLRKWERLHMSKSERRKIFCSVLFHLIAIVCMLWSVYILVKRTAEEVRLGKNGILEWPFWTKLVVVAIGFTGGLIFMYIQCKVYLQLWRRLKAFNRIITVQNCPEKNHPPSCQSRPGVLMNGKVDPVVVPVISAPAPASEAQLDSDQSVEAAVAPVQNPI